MSVELLGRDNEVEFRPKPKRIQILGGGANTEHFSGALRGLQESSEVHLAEIRHIDPSEVPHDVLYRLDTEVGKELYERAMGEEAFAVYISLPPHLHVKAIKEQLERYARGLVEYIVVTKPAVINVAQMKEVDEALANAKNKRAELGFEVASSPLVVHEHYVAKGAWVETQERLSEVMNHLGRLESAVVSIEEAKTVEDEGREIAFGGGAFDDLGPHVISIGLEVEQAFRKSERFDCIEPARLEFERYRYADSRLPDGVDTGFVVYGETTLIDKKADPADENNYHELPFVWQGGKGLQNKKEVLLNFEHPETGERTTLRVDLLANRIEPPEGVRHLFTETQFSDNGYGESVRTGLSGETIAESFQEWDAARAVIKIGAAVWSKAKVDGEVKAPMVYERDGRSLDVLQAA